MTEQTAHEQTAHSLKSVPFPECGTNCATITILGAGECESVCPYKFDKDGESRENWDKGLEEATWADLKFPKSKTIDDFCHQLVEPDRR